MRRLKTVPRDRMRAFPNLRLFRLLLFQTQKKYKVVQFERVRAVFLPDLPERLGQAFSSKEADREAARNPASSFADGSYMAT